MLRLVRAELVGILFLLFEFLLGSSFYDEVTIDRVDIISTFSAGDRRGLPWRDVLGETSFARDEEVVSDERILGRALPGNQAGEPHRGAVR